MGYSNIDFILIILMLLIPLVSQLMIKINYARYKKIKNKSNISGFEVARKILDANGLDNIYVVETSGDLTDHYDPTRKVIRLSSDIFKGTSIASASVAAHECGHAIQDRDGYKPMRFRSFLVPIVNLVSQASWYIVFLGIAAQYFKLFIIGIALICIGLLFHLITLPVEFDASSRAKEELKKLQLVNSDESEGVAKMLYSAAMTYVASVLSSVVQILRLFLRYSNNRK